MTKWYQSNFTTGELSPKMFGRVDFAKYFNGLDTLENAYVHPHGGLSRRPGFEYVADALYHDRVCRLVPFVFSTTQAYMLEFGHRYIRFYMDGAQITSGGSPYEVFTPYDDTELDELMFAQSADTLYIAHGSHSPRKLTRTAHTSWTVTTIQFMPPPISQHTWEPDTTITPGATTGTGVTFTAGASTFQNADVGRQIVSGQQIAVITAYVSATQVTCDVVYTFDSTSAIASGSWYVQGIPSGTLSSDTAQPWGAIATITAASGGETLTDLVTTTYKWTGSGSGTNEYYCEAAAGGDPSLSAPDKLYGDDVEFVEGEVGTLGINQWCYDDNDALGYDTVYIRLSSGADPDGAGVDIQASDVDTWNVFRSTDVGKYIYMHGGTLKITSYTNAYTVKATILYELDEDSEDTETAVWDMREEDWDSSDGYPNAVIFHDDRLFFLGSSAYPNTVWGSRVGDYENFSPGTDDDASITFAILSRQVNAILWAASLNSGIVIGTNAGEFYLSGGDSPITPSNAAARLYTSNGSAQIQPAQVDNRLLMVRQHARKLMEWMYNYDSDGYVGNNLSVLSDHMTKTYTITDVAFQREPNSICWCVRSDGVLLGATYYREHEVVGWHRHTTENGEFESVAVIPGDDTDDLYVVVKRTFGVHTYRYIEILHADFDDDEDTEDAFYVDSGLTYDGDAATTISGLDHLKGVEVQALADGAYDGTHVVNSDGEITLTASASKVHVGIGYTTTIKTLPAELPPDIAMTKGSRKRLAEVVIRFYQTINAIIGDDTDDMYDIPFRIPSDTTGIAVLPYTGDIVIPFTGNFELSPQVILQQTNPLPLTILAIAYKFEAHDD